MNFTGDVYIRKKHHLPRAKSINIHITIKDNLLNVLKKWAICFPNGAAPYKDKPIAYENKEYFGSLSIFFCFRRQRTNARY